MGLVQVRKTETDEHKPFGSWCTQVNNCHKCTSVCSYDWANSVYFQVIITLMGPLFINHLASLKAYGDMKGCNATEGIVDINYTKATYTIQNYTVSTKFGA